MNRPLNGTGAARATPEAGPASGGQPTGAGPIPSGGQGLAGGDAGASAGGAGSEPPAGTGGQEPGVPPPASTVPAPGYDPSVIFDWPETPPGDGSECPAGTYTGTYTCTFTQANSLFPLVIELTGPVSITLVESADGEFLEITDGDFAAVANGLVGARAQIRGRLDCSTLMLNATAEDGMWAIGDPDLPVVPGGALEGDITGTLDPVSGTLSGDWTFGDPALGDCPGTWSARYVP